MQGFALALSLNADPTRMNFEPVTASTHASVPLAETEREEVIEVDPDVDIAAEEENKVINEVHINYPGAKY